MAERKTRFEVVPLAAIAPLVGDAEILGGAKRTSIKMIIGRILSVSYDRSLAATREMLFSSVGLHVASALTMENAIELCQNELFDLIVVGHSMPIRHRQELVRELRRRCDAPVLALYRSGEPRLAEANYAFDSTQSPAALLEAVSGILKSKTLSAASIS
jgi:CheY-like chemotaxis protein